VRRPSRNWLLRGLLPALLLTVAYLLALGSADPVDAAIGAVVAVAILLAFRRFLRGPDASPNGSLRRVLAFFPFAAVVLWDVIRGTWEVSLVVLRVRPLVSPGIVRVPIGERTELGVVVSSLALTISPGEFLVDVDWERREMLVHVIDARDPDGIRARFDDFYARWQRAVFP
jgi:multicomponent Na+:H+ antiporter subunit E